MNKISSTIKFITFVILLNIISILIIFTVLHLWIGITLRPVKTEDTYAGGLECQCWTAEKTSKMPLYTNFIIPNKEEGN